MLRYVNIKRLQCWIFYEENYMTVAEQVATLKSRHAEIEKNIEDEIGRPQPDHNVVAGLKKQKLRIKDELFELGAQ